MTMSDFDQTRPDNLVLRVTRAPQALVRLLEPPWLVAQAHIGIVIRCGPPAEVRCTGGNLPQFQCGTPSSPFGLSECGSNMCTIFTKFEEDRLHM